MKYFSVCSGIEAASVAWEPLGWEPVGFCEIEPFPSAVLAHRFPGVPNHGDMTKVDPSEVAKADVLVGGTPCQAFSVAGLRGSLADARGNLTLYFARLADAVDDLRLARGDGPLTVVWENVPGILSTKDNAFGCLLGALAGHGDALVPPGGGRWGNAGVVRGPRRTVAWRVIDAQWFGVAQRRRRVFVLARANAGGWAVADALLPLGESVRRDPPPRRKAREELAPTLAARTRGGGGLGTDFELDGGLISPSWWDGRDVSQTLDAVLSKGQCLPEKDRFPAVLHPMPIDTNNICPPANHSAPKPGDPPAIVFTQNQREEVRELEVAACINLQGTHQTNYVAAPVVFQPRFARNGRGAPDTEVAGPLTAQAGADGRGDAAQCVAYLPEVTHTLKAEGHDASEDGTGRGTPMVATFQQSSMTGKGTVGYDDSGVAKPCKTQMDGQMLHQGMAVRRLTPRECERLQGFPDDWTLIPWRGKPAAECPDGPRYKACGNSMAVPVMRWIGQRIAKVVQP